MPETQAQAKTVQAKIRIEAICPECGETVCYKKLEPGKNIGEERECDYCDLKVAIPDVLVKKESAPQADGE